MIVCICHRVSDRDIAREARSGCPDFETLQDRLRVATGCGACDEFAREAFDEHCAGVCGAGSRHHHAVVRHPAEVERGVPA